jgi:hypothetical protein
MSQVGGPNVVWYGLSVRPKILPKSANSVGPCLHQDPTAFGPPSHRTQQHWALPLPGFNALIYFFLLRYIQFHFFSSLNVFSFLLMIFFIL